MSMGKYETHATCEMCGDFLLMTDPKLSAWEMQYLHLSTNESDTVRFLTCAKCKSLGPQKFLAKLGVEL